MTTTMVTARMDEAKKMRGNAILKKRGKTPSAAINELYDFIIKESDLPWKEEKTSIKTMSRSEVGDLREFLREIQVENSPFSNMSDQEIREERMRARNLI